MQTLLSIRDQIDHSIALEQRTKGDKHPTVVLLRKQRDLADQNIDNYVKAWKEKYVGIQQMADGTRKPLPGNLDAMQENVRQLKGMLDAAQTRAAIMAKKKREIDRLQRLQASRRNVQPPSDAKAPPGPATTKPSTPFVLDGSALGRMNIKQMELSYLLRELAKARQQLGEQHPTVERLKRELEQVRREMEELAPKVQEERAAAAARGAGPVGPAAPEALPRGRAGAGVYYLGGSVPRPGAYPMSADHKVNLLQALIAGGFDLEANPDKAVVLLRRPGHSVDRGGQEVVTTRLVKDVFDRTRADVFLEPDDVVMVRTGAPPAAPATRRSDN